MIKNMILFGNLPIQLLTSHFGNGTDLSILNREPKIGEGISMGQLYNTKVAIEEIAKKKNLDGSKVFGQIGLKSGILFALVKPDSPDDPGKLARLRAAAQEVLGVTV